MPEGRAKSKKEQWTKKESLPETETVTILTPGVGPHVTCSKLDFRINKDQCMSAAYNLYLFDTESWGLEGQIACLLHSQMSGSGVAAPEEFYHIQT